MHAPLYVFRFNNSVARNQGIRFRKRGALQKHIVVGIAADLYRASNLYADAAGQNRLQRRCSQENFSVKTRIISTSISSQVAITSSLIAFSSASVGVPRRFAN